eukprot:TRINITY_DN63404_c0_g1_i1.p1 TRINITY_DN63404_c0_g1~~TRINITY_DN63404_c0_g1_i1.p1  ORF type:complete len:199 (-),score=0.40 TRINITY_DN63404_c0_g1_i1:163-759(-)
MARLSVDNVNTRYGPAVLTFIHKICGVLPISVGERTINHATEPAGVDVFFADGDEEVALETVLLSTHTGLWVNSEWCPLVIDGKHRRMLHEDDEFLQKGVLRHHRKVQELHTRIDRAFEASDSIERRFDAIADESKPVSPQTYHTHIPPMYVLTASCDEPATVPCSPMASVRLRGIPMYSPTSSTAAEAAKATLATTA